MNILITWNDGIKGNYEINLNDKIISLLNCIPDNMKDMTYKERFVDTINYIVRCFSFLLDKNVNYDNKQFAEAIKDYYSLDNLKVKYSYEFLIAI